MKTYATLLFLSLLLILPGAFAQPAPTGGNNPNFSQQELDQMLAPIALYPDALLSQVLMAATYPLEIVQAARWSNANPNLNGDAAVRAVSGENWDPSVKSLVAFPQVLQTMDQKIEWTERLGDAFLAQQPQVMDTIQNLRHKAEQAGNLSSNSQIYVSQTDNDIEVAPVDPSVVYVPYYDPMVVYGSWWWPEYPPVFWSPWVGYVWNGVFAWGFGIGIGLDFFFGSWDWHHHAVYVGGPHRGGEPWHHDPGHRHGVPYRDANLNRQFERGHAASADSHDQFRGRAPAAGDYRGEPGNRAPTAPDRTSRPQEIRAPEQREIPAQRSEGSSLAEPRAHAFENVGRGNEVRSFSARGQQSLSGRPSASSHNSSGRASHSAHH